MKKAVIMCRVSSEEQTKGYSLDVQFDALNNYCVRNEIRVLKHFKEDYSAKDFNRPQWKNFMVYAKRNKAEIDFISGATGLDKVYLLRLFKRAGISF